MDFDDLGQDLCDGADLKRTFVMLARDFVMLLIWVGILVSLADFCDSDDFGQVLGVCDLVDLGHEFYDSADQVKFFF